MFLLIWQQHLKDMGMVLNFAVDAEAGLALARAKMPTRVPASVPQGIGDERCPSTQRIWLSPLAVLPTLHVPAMRWDV